MPNHVRDWMSSPVIVVDPDSSVSHALTLMRRRNIHSLLVDVSEDKPTYGIITTTDIRDKIIAADRNPANTAVREITPLHETCHRRAVGPLDVGAFRRPEIDDHDPTAGIA